VVRVTRGVAPRASYSQVLSARARRRWHWHARMRDAYLMMCGGSRRSTGTNPSALSRVCAPRGGPRSRKQRETFYGATHAKKHIKKAAAQQVKSCSIRHFSPQNLLKSNKNSHDPGETFFNARIYNHRGRLFLFICIYRRAGKGALGSFCVCSRAGRPAA
jgi:hypothetical protein